MTTSGQSLTTAQPVPARRRHRWMILPVGVSFASVVLLVAVMVGPRVCGLSLPGTIGCNAGAFDAALTAGMIGAAVVGVVVVVVGLLAPRLRRPVVVAGVSVIVTATLVLLVVRVALFGSVELWSSGSVF